MTLNEQLIYKLIGEHIRTARRARVPRISQIQLAKEIGVSRASVVNIEAGRQRPPLHVLWQIAEILGTDIAALIPTQAEYTQHEEPTTLTEDMVVKIAEASEGDTETSDRLTEFVSRARKKP